eukprot:TRINITY_DN4180_c0_g1_i5.p1 TRINITY_DN4180_c0_g1~~TRINITY_DN4180_c0_g1_i5.p1  ORF type:complete len:310 (-),score=54.45 TRINITY_DN4180_c0_g1_i5:120-1049(-)
MAALSSSSSGSSSSSSSTNSSSAAAVHTPYTNTNALVGCGIAVDVLSILTCTFVVVVTLAIPKLRRSFRSRLILHLCLCDAIYATFTLISLAGFKISNGHVPHGFCDTCGFFRQTFVIASLIWVDCIAVTMLVHALSISYHNRVWFRWWTFCAVSYVPAVAAAILPLFDVGDGYGVVSAWCWVIDFEARLYFLYVEIWATVAFAIVVYIFIFVFVAARLRRKAKEMDAAERKAVQQHGKAEKSHLTMSYYTTLFKQLAPYPLLLIVIWIIPTINRVWSEIDPGAQPFWLQCLQLVLQESNGFFNAVRLR